MISVDQTTHIALHLLTNDIHVQGHDGHHVRMYAGQLALQDGPAMPVAIAGH